MVDATIALCETSVYLSIGVFDLLKGNLYQTASEKYNGHSGIVEQMIGLAQIHEKWFKDRKIEYEEITDGVYLYDVIETLMARWVVDHFKQHGYLPLEQNVFDWLDSLR